MVFLGTSCRGTALPDQKGKVLHQQLFWVGKVGRMLYSLPYTYHLLDIERNNCWVKVDSRTIW